MKMHMMIRWGLAAALFAMLSTAQARSAPMVQPGPVELVTAPSATPASAAVRAALLHAAANHGWIVASDEPGLLRLRYDKGGKHSVTIAASYDDKGFELKYVESTNLNYEQRPQGAVIHPNYNKWIDTMIRETKANFLASGIK